MTAEADAFNAELKEEAMNEFELYAGGDENGENANNDEDVFEGLSDELIELMTDKDSLVTLLDQSKD